MHPRIFTLFKDEELTKPLRVIKRVGQVSLMIFVIYLAYHQVGGNKQSGTPLLELINLIVTVSIVISFISFAVVALAATGKKNNNTTIQAIGRSFLKVCLYVVLPSIIFTILLIVGLNYTK